MRKGFFITATDTGTGKTVVAGAVIKAMQSMGTTVCAMKPVESGCARKGDVLVPGDGSFLKEISHMPEPLSGITPCCFETPLAPLAASEIEKKKIDLTAVREAYEKLCERYEAIVVEGIGGLMVPLTDSYYVADLAKDFDLPLIIVAKPGLGTINHTLLTVQCAREAGLEIAGIVLNYSSPPENSLAEKTNPQILKLLSPVPLLGIFPYLESLDEDSLEKEAVSKLDLNALKKYIL